jgi:hypothetical protein
MAGSDLKISELIVAGALDGTEDVPMVQLTNTRRSTARDVADLAIKTEGQTVTGGGGITSKDLGTISSGTVTPNPSARPMQHYTNNGAHTLAPSATTGTMTLDITNGASAGVITDSGWTKRGGDAWTTTSGHKFKAFVSIGAAGSLLSVQAMQ